MRVARSIVLSEEQRGKLMGYARGRSIAKRVVERASIVLQAADGKQDLEIAADLQIGRHSVARWRARFPGRWPTGDREGCFTAGQNAHD